MTKTQRSFSIDNENGVLTLDFVFALCVSVGLITVLLALSWTLAVFEVTQYVSFAVARNYSGTHFSEIEQKAQAKRKFVQLTKDNKVLRALYGSSWFKISTPSEMDANIGDFNSDFPQDDGGRPTFVGARIDITAKALEIKFPLIGNTYESDDSFKTYLGSYLIRSPSESECLQFNQNRYQQLKTLDGNYSSAAGNGYYVISDNGC